MVGVPGGLNEEAEHYPPRRPTVLTRRFAPTGPLGTAGYHLKGHSGDLLGSLVVTKLIPGPVMIGADGDAVSMPPEEETEWTSRRIHTIPTHTYRSTSEFLSEIVLLADIWFDW